MRLLIPIILIILAVVLMMIALSCNKVDNVPQERCPIYLEQYGYIENAKYVQYITLQIKKPFGWDLFYMFTRTDKHLMITDSSYRIMYNMSEYLKNVPRYSPVYFRCRLYDERNGSFIYSKPDTLYKP